MSDRAPAARWDQRLFTLLWIWVSFRTLVPWLVSFRLTFEGSSYVWGSRFFGRMFRSAGLERPDVLVIYGLLAASLLLLYLLRRHRLRAARPLLLVYLGFFAANALYQLLADKPVVFVGDTLGVRIDLTLPFFVLNFGMFGAGVLWWWGCRDVEAGPGPLPLSGYRRALVVACAAFVPLQLVLLIVGEPHGTADAIGVVGTLAQWSLLAFALYPGAGYRTG